MPDLVQETILSRKSKIKIINLKNRQVLVKKSRNIPRFLRYPLTDKIYHDNSRNLRNTRVLSGLSGPFYFRKNKDRR